MKKIGIVFSLFTFAIPLYAVSTCETRVDSHPDATTLQRVDYCLTPEQAASQPAGPEVVYASITDKTPEKQQPEKVTPLKQKYYNEDEIEIAHDYIDTSYFPVLKNDIPTQRELQQQQAQAAQQAPQEVKPQRNMNGKKQKKPAKQITAQSVAPSAEKPARTMAVLPEQTPVQADEPQAVAVSQPEEQIPLTQPNVSDTFAIE